MSLGQWNQNFLHLKQTSFHGMMLYSRGTYLAIHIWKVVYPGLLGNFEMLSKTLMRAI